MSFIKHIPLFPNVISAPSAWTQSAEFLGESYVLRENDSFAQIAIDVPHLTGEELTVNLNGNTIIVAGNRKECGHSEKFERHFVVDSADASQIKANVHDGVLLLTIQKRQCATKIPITEGPPDCGAPWELNHIRWKPQGVWQFRETRASLSHPRCGCLSNQG
jgi:hypothetical protein